MLRRNMLRISLGGWFELYDLFMTAYIALGLVRAGLFVPTSASPFAVRGLASFISAGFAGMFAGTLIFSWISDRFGRKTTFTFSLLWYSLANAAMAFSSSSALIDLWRFIAGVGIGVQLVTIDAYISEVAPKDQRGYWIAFSQFVGYFAIPTAALLAYFLVPRTIGGFAGWRYVALVGSTGSLLVLWLRRGLPESERWLRARASTVAAGAAAWRRIFRPPYRTRTVMLVVFNFAQTIGFYGFASWIPILLASEGVGFVKSLLYTFIIAIVNPAGPLLAMHFADRAERKWQIVWLACTIAISGVLFSHARSPAAILILGSAITLANAWFSCAFHAYQAELFPTGIRAQAIGFVYAWSRFSSIFVGFLIAALLRSYGVPGVFAVIALAMAIVAVTIALFGMRTNRRELEELRLPKGKSVSRRRRV